MKTSLFAALFLVCMVNVPATDKPGTVHLFKYSCPGREMEFRVSEVRYAQLPIWTPDRNEKPPIDMLQALAVAKAHIKLKYPAYTSFETVSISLHRTFAPERGSRFYYEITLDGMIDEKRGPSCGLACLVFLDGTILDPQPLD